MHDYLFLFSVLTAPDHLRHAAETINCSGLPLVMIEMPPRSGKTSLATAYVKSMATNGEAVLYVSLLPKQYFYFSPESKNITVIPPLGASYGKMFDLVVVDDAIRTPVEGDNPKYISDLVSWWETVVLSRVAKDGKVVVIGCRYGKDDFMGKVRKGKVDLFSVPALDHHGRSYWPEMFPVPVLENIHKSIGDKRFDWMYNQGFVFETRAVARPYDD